VRRAIHYVPHAFGGGEHRAEVERATPPDTSLNPKLSDHSDAMPSSDAIVIFGVTGDLAHKKIIPARYAMVSKGVLHRNTVSRKLSRLSARIKALGAAS